MFQAAAIFARCWPVDAQKNADACEAEETRLVSQIDTVGKTKLDLAKGLAERKTDLAAATGLSSEAQTTAKKELAQWLRAYDDALATEEKLRTQFNALRVRHEKLESIAHDVIVRVDDARSRLADTAVDVMVGQSDALIAATASTIDEVGSLARGPREFEAVLARLRAPMTGTLADMSTDELTAQVD